MLRLYCADFSPHHPITLSDSQSHYITHVMRLKDGDTLHVFNAQQGEWSSTITQMHKKGVVVLPQILIRVPEITPTLHLAFGALKNDAMHMVIEKATELGVTDLWPLETLRSVAKFNAERAQAQAMMAAQQCERLDIPTIHPTLKLPQFIATFKDPIIVAQERHETAPLGVLLSKAQAFLIGPEGGFSPEEHNLFASKDHILPCSLGQRILRAETAALMCLSAFQCWHQTPDMLKKD